MKNSFIDYLIPIYASIFTIYLIIFLDMTPIEAFMVGIGVGIVLIIVGLFKTPVEEWMKDKIKRKKLHRKELVNEILKKEFLNMNITYNKQNFEVLITDLKELKEKKEKMYGYALQHLKAYQPILDSWNESSEIINSINKTLNGNEESEGLVKYIFDKVETEIDENHKKGLCHSIQHILEEAIKNDFKKISIKTRKDGVFILISLSGEIWAQVNCKTYSRTKIKKFLKNLENDIQFQDLINIRHDYKELNSEFYNKFKSRLKALLEFIKNREEDFSGRCEECSFWMRLLGDY